MSFKKRSLKHEFKLLKKLGSGAFSNVYHVERREDKREYALKKVDFNILETDRDRENAINEVRILASIRNEHIISFYEAFVDHDLKSLW